MTRARIQVLAAALLFSTGGAAIKSIELTGWQIACFRSGVAVLVLLAVLPGRRRVFQPRILEGKTGIRQCHRIALHDLLHQLPVDGYAGLRVEGEQHTPPSH